MFSILLNNTIFMGVNITISLDDKYINITNNGTPIHTEEYANNTASGTKFTDIKNALTAKDTFIDLDTLL